MEYSRALLAVAVAVAVGVATLSGPLAADVGTTTAEPDRLGNGSADVTVAELPRTVSLVEREGGHDLRVPDATVDVERLDGRPGLVYKLRIPALGYARSTTAFPEASGQHRLAIAGGSPSVENERERYEGELLVAIRSGADRRVLERRNVTVVVA